MAKNNEGTFGNRLAKGQQLLEYIKTLPDYNPPNETLKVSSFTELLNKINEANNKVASLKDLLAQVRITREETYYGADGAKKRCAMIRDFVGVLPAGQTSSAYISIKKEVQKMNNYKKPTKKEEDDSIADIPAKRSISNAETSFGSVLQSLKNVLEVIKNIPSYAPANPLITIGNFANYISDVEKCNQAVNVQIYPYNDIVVKRSELYEGEDGLHITFQSIKSFIAGSYGKDSIEFKEVSKIKY